MVNLRAFGLCELAEAFDKLSKFIANEKNISLKNIKKVTHICKSCVQQCLKKRNFSRHLPKQISPDHSPPQRLYQIFRNFSLISEFSLILT